MGHLHAENFSRKPRFFPVFLWFLSSSVYLEEQIWCPMPIIVVHQKDPKFEIHVEIMYQKQTNL